MCLFRTLACADHCVLLFVFRCLGFVMLVCRFLALAVVSGSVCFNAAVSFGASCSGLQNILPGVVKMSELASSWMFKVQG